MREMLCCYECFKPLTPEDESETVICGSCGAKLELKTVRTLLAFTRAAVTEGYVYPLVYERDRERGVQRRYQLEIDAVLVWLGLAALAGIIGGVSYDFAKALMRRILQRDGKTTSIVSVGRTEFVDGKAQIISIGEKHVTTIELTDAQLERLLCGVAEYTGNWRDPGWVERTRQGVLSGLPQMVDAMMPLVEQLAEASSAKNTLDREQMLRYLREHMEAGLKPVAFPQSVVSAIGRAAAEEELSEPS